MKKRSSNSAATRGEFKNASLRIGISSESTFFHFGINYVLQREFPCEIERVNQGNLTQEALIGNLDLLIIDLADARVHRKKTAELITHLRSIPIIVFLQKGQLDCVSFLVRAGAQGILMKACSASDLLQALHRVRSGERFMSPEVAAFIEKSFLDCEGMKVEEAMAELTPQEQKVLEMLAHGSGNKEIAGQLSISIRTVENHRAAVLKKLRLKNFADLIKFAVRHCITTLD
jgi:two-component system, NarL family, response regulator NreC